MSLADESVVFYPKLGRTNPLVRDTRASCYSCFNWHQVDCSAKFASVQHILRAFHRAKCNGHILVDAQMCAIKCGWADAFHCVLSKFLCLVFTFTGRFRPSDALQYMSYPLETTFELGIKPKIAVNAREMGIAASVSPIAVGGLSVTSPHGRPLCYSHNVNVKCLILRRFCILKYFQGYCRLSNHLQI